MSAERSPCTVAPACAILARPRAVAGLQRNRHAIPVPTALIAFDKFKGAVSARQACEAAARALRRARPSWDVDIAPLTDGGEGFCETLVSAVDGSLVQAEVHGPLGALVTATVGTAGACSVEPEALDAVGLPRGSRARLLVVELATASGLSLVPPGSQDPWRTSTHGTGELLALARDHGCERVLLGVGGSATSDLGLGALQALGYRFLVADGSPLDSVTPSAWPFIARIEPPHSIPIPPVVVACDVSNPLLGDEGAAAVYGPQKGLGRQDLHVHERLARHMAYLLCDAAGKDPALIDHPGAGAAGGIGFGLMVGLGARLVGGFDLVARWLGLSRRVASAHLVLTGEGRFDASSLAGKGPGALLRLTQQLGTPAMAFVGDIAAEIDGSRLPVRAITSRAVPPHEAMARTEEWLEQSIFEWLRSEWPSTDR